VAAILGLTVGLLLYSPSRKRYRFPQGRSSIPYAGQKRWHTILGLVFGLVACTWVFSGMLSMDPFAWDRPAAETALQQALTGGELMPARFEGKSPREAAEASASRLRIKEIEFSIFGGEPVHLLRESEERSLKVPLHGAPAEILDPALVTRILAAAVKPVRLAETRVVTRYESYYIDRHGDRPLPVLFARLNDAVGSMYYLDLKTGGIVQSYVAQSRSNRWLYHGLHSFDLPLALPPPAGMGYHRARADAGWLGAFGDSSSDWLAPAAPKSAHRGGSIRAFRLAGAGQTTCPTTRFCYFPTRCCRSRLFSWQMYSNNSWPGAQFAVVTTVQGFV
jgi:hypothetical protein